MSVNVRIPGLAWDDMMGGSYGQEALLTDHPPEDFEEPGIVRAIRAAKTVRSGRGFYASIDLETAADADGLLVLAEALAVGAAENDDMRAEASALRKAVVRLADAKTALAREGAGHHASVEPPTTITVTDGTTTHTVPLTTSRPVCENAAAAPKPEPVRERSERVQECRECGSDSYPWAFDGEHGWACGSCGSDEIVEVLMTTTTEGALMTTTYVPAEVGATLYTVERGGADEIEVGEAKVLRIGPKTLTIEIARTYSEPYTVRVDRVPFGSAEGCAARRSGSVYFTSRETALRHESDLLHRRAKEMRERADEFDARAARTFFMSSTGKDDPQAERLKEARIEAYRIEREDRIAERRAL